MRPGFSERTFEFCFNAEFCQALGGLLVSHPHIPSQQMEKDLGYDVEFQIRQGQYTGSIFIQHKVAHFAEARAGRNGEFFDHHAGPYFRFAVDNEQHNTLCELSRTKGDAYYCAPSFHLSHELEGHFRASSISGNSLLLDPLDVGDITDTERHNITFAPNGLNPALYSDVRRFKRPHRANKDELPEFKKRKIDTAYLEEVSDEIVNRTVRSKFRGSVTRSVERMKPLEKAQFLLGRVYKVSWVLVP
ncbi:MAG: adenylosuccinate lyase [Gammaproteobacteria bacterium]|nr:adenylosuccinate lyase [Gammaproteobacteria bacterium]